MEFGGSNVRGACYNCLFSRPLNLMFSFRRYNSSLLRFSPSMRGGNAVMASYHKKNIRTIITTPPKFFATGSQNWYKERDGGNYGAGADQRHNVGGEGGHQARECPKRGTPVCYNCGQDGHMSRDCTSPTKEKSCYRCGQSGHLSRDCSEPPQAGGNYGGNSSFGGGQGGGAECYKCGKVGHIARQCTAGGMQQQGGYSAPSNRAQTCYSCGGYGHLSRDCTQGQKCYNCGQIGHLSRDCPSEQDRVCYKCKQPGHVMAACPEGQAP